MDIASLINPTIISSAAGVVLAGVVVLVSVLFHKQIGAAVKSGVTGFGAWVKVYILNWKAFFWFVNIVCMVFSSQNAGYFFGLYEPVGIALAFVLDLMIIAFMQAMLTARMRGDTIRVRLIIFFIALCASLSTIGNLAHNLHVQQDIASRISHVWFGDWAPYIASCVPLLLVLLALVADIATKKSAEDMDLAEFEAEEKRQVEMLEIRNTYLQRRKEADYRSQLLQGKRPGSFRYPWEHRITNQEIIDQINEQNKTKEDAAKKAFGDQFATLQKRAKELEAEQFLTIQNMTKEAELRQAEQVAIEQAKHEQTLNYLIGQISELTTLLDSVKGVQSQGDYTQDSEEIADQTYGNSVQDYDSNSERSTMQSQGNLEQDQQSISRQSHGNLTPDHNANSRQSIHQTDGNLSAISGRSTRKQTDELNSNSVQSSQRLSSKVTRNLDEIEISSSSKQYAITKKEAALQKRCSVKAIEQGITEGTVKEYGNNKEKVLVSSLKNFTPNQKTRVA